MRILGLDPGSVHTGYGCVELERGKCRLVDQGRISCRSGEPLDSRLLRLCGGVDDVVARFQPAVAVLEEPFHGVNSRSLIVLAQARGALLLALARCGIAVEEYTPAEVKSAVTGNGRADKVQVARMVGLLLSVPVDRLSSDAADALAVALCYAARRPLEVAVGGRRGG